MNPERRKLFLITGSIIGILVIIGIIISVISINANKNQYGEAITIKGYDQKVKNLSKEYKDNISAALYDAVKFNSEGEVKASDIKDATIRDGSDKQGEIERASKYTGSFIVDIPSITQSYKIQYSYSSDPNDPILSGYPILVDCVPTEDVIYKDFKCKSILSGNTTKEDPIISNLPKETLGYKLWADTTSGTLVLNANLRIPEIDLSGNENSRRDVVAHYKQTVIDWITSLGLDASKYTINYDYSDTGEKIRN